MTEGAGEGHGEPVPGGRGARVEVRVLGPPEVIIDGRTLAVAGRRSRTLLVRLAWSAPEWVSSERLAPPMWGPALPSNPRKAVQMHVSRLRATLDADLIESNGTGHYRLGSSCVRDVDRFLSLCAAAEGEVRAQRCDAGRPLAEAAMALWRGEPWGDLDEPAVEADRVALAGVRRRLEFVLAESLVCSDPHRALVQLERLVPHAVDPDRHDRVMAHAHRLAATSS